MALPRAPPSWPGPCPEHATLLSESAHWVTLDQPLGLSGPQFLGPCVWPGCDSNGKRPPGWWGGQGWREKPPVPLSAAGQRGSGGPTPAAAASAPGAWGAGRGRGASAQARRGGAGRGRALGAAARSSGGARRAGRRRVGRRRLARSPWITRTCQARRRPPSPGSPHRAGPRPRPLPRPLRRPLPERQVRERGSASGKSGRQRGALGGRPPRDRSCAAAAVAAASGLSARLGWGAGAVGGCGAAAARTPASSPRPGPGGRRAWRRSTCRS